MLDKWLKLISKDTVFHSNWGKCFSQSFVKEFQHMLFLPSRIWYQMNNIDGSNYRLKEVTKLTFRALSPSVFTLTP